MNTIIYEKDRINISYITLVKYYDTNSVFFCQSCI